jgi:hypothetical protein
VPESLVYDVLHPSLEARLAQRSEERLETAGKKSPELRKKYEAKVQELLAKGEHAWLKGMMPGEAEALRKEYRQRYDQ